MDKMVPLSYSIAKFGGTSVADYTSMCRCADIVLKDEKINIVVTSASAGVTNLLVALATGRRETVRKQHFKKITDIQLAILARLTKKERIWPVINNLLNDIRMLSEAAALASSPALTDKLVAHGELLSSYLFTEILKQKGAKAHYFDIRNVMRTDDNFGNAVPEIETLKPLCCAYLKSASRTNLIVTQGFIGCDALGRTTTLGRGGSDYTAALLGEALGASHIAIWTDVSGIYTCDPALIRTAGVIPAMTFSEAMEMAYFGAKVLHPATVVPAMRASMPIFIGSSKAPKDGGTWITSAPISSQPSVRAITSRRSQQLLTLEHRTSPIDAVFLANIFSVIAKFKLTIDAVFISEVNLTLILDPNRLTTLLHHSSIEAVCTELNAFGKVTKEDGFALVTLIGDHFGEPNTFISRIFTLLASFSIRLCTFGHTAHSLCILVHESDADIILQLMHDTFFNNNLTTIKAFAHKVSN